MKMGMVGIVAHFLFYQFMPCFKLQRAKIIWHEMYQIAYLFDSLYCTSASLLPLLYLGQ